MYILPIIATLVLCFSRLILQYLLCHLIVFEDVAIRYRTISRCGRWFIVCRSIVHLTIVRERLIIGTERSRRSRTDEAYGSNFEYPTRVTRLPVKKSIYNIHDDDDDISTINRYYLATLIAFCKTLFLLK